MQSWIGLKTKTPKEAVRATKFQPACSMMSVTRFIGAIRYQTTLLVLRSVSSCKTEDVSLFVIVCWYLNRALQDKHYDGSGIFLESLQFSGEHLAPGPKSALKLTEDYLTALIKHLKYDMNRRFGEEFIAETPIDYVVTVPAMVSDCFAVDTSTNDLSYNSGQRKRRSALLKHVTTQASA